MLTRHQGQDRTKSNPKYDPIRLGKGWEVGSHQLKDIGIILLLLSAFLNIKAFKDHLKQGQQK